MTKGDEAYDASGGVGDVGNNIEEKVTFETNE